MEKGVTKNDEISLPIKYISRSTIDFCSATEMIKKVNKHNAIKWFAKSHLEKLLEMIARYFRKDEFEILPQKMSKIQLNSWEKKTYKD